MESRTRSPRVATIALSLWLATGAFYGLTGAGHSTSVDGMLIFLAAHNLLETGRPSVPEVPHTEPHRKIGLDGRWYPKYGPGLILAHVPALLLARLGDPLRPAVGEATASPLRRDEFYAQLTNAWVTASTVTFLFLCGLALGFGVGPSLAVAVLCAVTSPLWVYAHVDSTEALQALGFVGGFYGLLRARRSPHPEQPALGAGVFLAIAIAAKLTNVIVAPLYLLYALTTRTGGKRVRTLAACAIPIVLTMGLLGLFNVWRFGAWLDTGYDLATERFDRSLLTGIAVLLFSPQYGLLVFFPVLALGIFRLRQTFRELPREAALSASVGTMLLLTYAGWWAFWGMNWGPRFLVPAMPLLAFFLLPVVASGSRALRVAVVTAATAGTVVQGLCVSVSFFPQVSAVYEELGLGERQGLVRDLRLAPLRIALWWNGLSIVAASAPEMIPERIAHPPWKRFRRWHNPEHAVERLPKLAGSDLWALPARWRRDYVSIWPFGERTAKPESTRLRIMLLLGLTAGLAGLAVSARRP